MGVAADRLGRVGKRLRTLPEEGVQSGNRRIRSAALVQLRRDAGADRKLSGVRNGVPQTVRGTTRRQGVLVEGRIMAGPARQRAPWFWLEEGTKSGFRGAPVGRYTSARANRGQHPGTPAKRTWSLGVRPALDETRKDFERLWREALAA